MIRPHSPGKSSAKWSEWNYDRPGAVKVTYAHYVRLACRDVAAGLAIQALDRFFVHIRNKMALEFVESELHSPRPATRKRPRSFTRSRIGVQ